MWHVYRDRRREGERAGETFGADMRDLGIHFFAGPRNFSHVKPCDEKTRATHPTQRNNMGIFYLFQKHEAIQVPSSMLIDRSELAEFIPSWKAAEICVTFYA